MSVATSVDILKQLCGWGSAPPLADVLLIVAHPDDEVIGAGALLPKWSGVRIVHVTDGAPRNGADASACGCSSTAEYACTRQHELGTAMQLVGIAPQQLFSFGMVDQEVSLHLVELTHTIVQFLQEQQPKVVVTHPYEGGHPDHDSTAFAVQSACRLLECEGEAPILVEMTSYHLGPHGITPCKFLPCPEREAVTVRLTAEERVLKQRLLDCFHSQRETLRWFPVGVECFRLAPHYDFTQPPHPGTLFYEKFDWGMTGLRWRRLARAALHELNLEGAK